MTEKERVRRARVQRFCRDCGQSLIMVENLYVAPSDGEFAMTAHCPATDRAWHIPRSIPRERTVDDAESG